MDQLLDAMRAQVFPQRRIEAMALYKVYNKDRGIMSRQPTESMIQYTTRRKRCWRKIKEMDPTIELSDTMRGDLMLEAAGLS